MATAAECSGFGGATSCAASTPGGDFPAATTTPYLEIRLPESFKIRGRYSLDAADAVRHVHRNRDSGVIDLPAVERVSSSGADVYVAAVNQSFSNELSAYPVSPSFVSVPPGGDAPSAVPAVLSTTAIGTAGASGTQVTGSTWTDGSACGVPTVIIAPPGAISMTVKLSGGAGGRGGNGEGDASGTGYGGGPGAGGALSAGVSISSGQLITATTGCAGQSAPHGSGVVSAGGAGGAGWSNGGDGGDGAFCWALIGGGKCLALPISYGVNGSGGGGGGSSAVCLGNCRSF